MLNVFRNDAFSAATLTDAFTKTPYVPGRIGKLGLFSARGIRTTTAIVEMKDGQLSLIQTTPRGGPGSNIGGMPRSARSFVVPHLERDSRITADEVQDVRQFGSEDALEGVQAVIDERQADLRQMHEVTHEYHRVGAIKGVILDADGTSTVHNLFTEFGVSQQVEELDLAANVRSQVVGYQRLVEAELGATPVSGYRAFCGDTFFDELIDSPSVVETLKRQDSKVLREDLRSGFEFAGVVWENYRGSVGGTAFFPTDEAYLVPEGTGIFKMYFAPADFMEAVNTIGLPVYSKIAEGEMNRWAKLHTQSNPLALNLRPRAVVKITLAT